MRKKIGFFGGSFDPVHFGHINLALELLEKKALQQVFFCPAFVSPYKQNRPPKVSVEHRLKMLELALHDIKQFQIFDWEIKQQKISYTIDTLLKIKNMYPDADIYLLLSQDTLVSLTGWKDYRKILEIATVLVGFRDDSKFIMPAELKPVLKNSLIATRQLHISSTCIRERLKKKLYCGHLLDKQVLDYIYQHQLY